jgi:hypothetical protein
VQTEVHGEARLGARSQRRPSRPDAYHGQPGIQVAQSVQTAIRAEGWRRDFPGNRLWAHLDSNHGHLLTANGRRPESVKLLGWTEATARGVFLPRHEEAFDLRAEEAVAESPLHRPQVTL